MLQQDPEIITGGPVIWRINISSCSRLPKIWFFPCTEKWADQPFRNVPFPAKNQRSFRDQPSVQHPPAASRALTPRSTGTTSFNLHSPCPKPWATALGPPEQNLSVQRAAAVQVWDGVSRGEGRPGAPLQTLHPSSFTHQERPVCF